MLNFVLRIFNQLFLGTIKKPVVQNPYTVAFRCWPVDLDLFMHMNNASYFRVSELSRWRMFPASNMVQFQKKYGTMFLIVDQSGKYFKPIKPFQKYIVSSEITASDDKWIYHTHTFKQHPDDVKPNTEPIVYAEVKCKAVIKEKSGKTVKISTVVTQSEYYKKMIEMYKKQEQ